MSRFLMMLIASLSLSVGALAAEKSPAPKAQCTCASQGEKCSGGCCSACSGEKSAGDKACTCKSDGCKACPRCKGKHHAS